MDATAFDAAFWTFFVASAIGLVLGLAKMAYKSKREEISRGRVEIARDVESEIEIDESRPSVVAANRNARRSAKRET